MKGCKSLEYDLTIHVIWKKNCLTCVCMELWSTLSLKLLSSRGTVRVVGPDTANRYDPWVCARRNGWCTWSFLLPGCFSRTFMIWGHGHHSPFSHWRRIGELIPKSFPHKSPMYYYEGNICSGQYLYISFISDTVCTG